VHHAALRRAPAKNDVVDAEPILNHAFFPDVAPAPARAAWRKANRLPADPLVEHRRTGHARAAAADRTRRRRELGLTPGGSFA
jgi:L-rhamnose isomerase